MAQACAESREAPQWRYREHPGLLRLRTAVAGFKKHQDGREESLQLKTAASFWINAPRLGLLVKVLGSARTSEDSQTLYYLSVRSSSLPGWIRRYFSAYAVIREMREASGTFDCVVGSGHVFETYVHLTETFLTKLF